MTVVTFNRWNASGGVATLSERSEHSEKREAFNRRGAKQVSPTHKPKIAIVARNMLSIATTRREPLPLDARVVNPNGVALVFQSPKREVSLCHYRDLLYW